VRYVAAHAKSNGMTAVDAVRSVVLDAAREFNAGRYFEAHEVLEDGLEEVPEPLWDLFVGLVQIAVGYHKATQQLWTGAARMLEMGLEKTQASPAAAAGVNVEALRQRVRADIEALRGRRFDARAFARRPPRLQPLNAA
jgi:predicted metal-dependent hydrolase